MSVEDEEEVGVREEEADGERGTLLTQRMETVAWRGVVRVMRPRIVAPTVGRTGVCACDGACGALRRTESAGLGVVVAFGCFACGGC